jgi:hypothetical protein
MLSHIPIPADNAVGRGMREAVSQLLQSTHIGILGAAFQVNVDNQDRARESRGGSGLGLKEGGLNEPRRNDFLLDVEVLGIAMGDKDGRPSLVPGGGVWVVQEGESVLEAFKDRARALGPGLLDKQHVCGAGQAIDVRKDPQLAFQQVTGSGVSGKTLCIVRYTGWARDGVAGDGSGCRPLRWGAAAASRRVQGGHGGRSLRGGGREK